MYTEQEKEAIESVLAVFKDYLENREDCDIAYSNRMGYLFGVQKNMEYEELAYAYHNIISVNDLLRDIQMEFYLDVIDKYDNPEFQKKNPGLAFMDMANKEANENLNRILKEHNLPFEYNC